jgi:hypothetical protein
MFTIFLQAHYLCSLLGMCVLVLTYEVKGVCIPLSRVVRDGIKLDLASPRIKIEATISIMHN